MFSFGSAWYACIVVSLTERTYIHNTHINIYKPNMFWRLLPQFLFQLRLGSHSRSINIIKPIEFVGTMQFVIYSSLLFRHKGFFELLAVITFQIITTHLTTVNTKNNTLFSEMNVHFISDVSRYSNKHISCSNMQRYVDIHRWYRYAHAASQKTYRQRNTLSQYILHYYENV